MNKYQKLHYSYDDRAAMREGRRRPSLAERWESKLPYPHGRNEGGAPAPLVAATHRGPKP